MNRLTVRLYNNVVSLKNVDEFNLDNEITKAIQKLAAYENTELEPEQIDELNKMLLNDQIRHGRALDKLLEYQKLEKQGLLIKLPCKVGSDVYLIHNICNGKWTKIEKVKFGISLYNYFGKTVFLTREEAEKALEEIK